MGLQLNPTDLPGSYLTVGVWMDKGQVKIARKRHRLESAEQSSEF